MIIETGFLNHVALHDDGRVTIIRAMPRENVFLSIQLTEAEKAALRRVLDSAASPC